MITIDATALTLDLFNLSGIGQFQTRTPQVLTLATGAYRFGTLFSPGFEFSVMADGSVDYDPELTFLSGAGTANLKVIGCRIQVDATALVFNRFSLFDTGSGLGKFFSTGSIQTLTLVPGNYRFGSLFNPTFEFTVSRTGAVNYHANHTFLSGTGTTALKVIDCRIRKDSTELTRKSFVLSGRVAF